MKTLRGPRGSGSSAGWQAVQAGAPLIVLVVAGSLGLSVFFSGRDQARDIIYNRSSDAAARLPGGTAATSYSTPSARSVAEAKKSVEKSKQLLSKGTSGAAEEVGGRGEGGKAMSKRKFDLDAEAAKVKAKYAQDSYNMVPVPSPSSGHSPKA